jgi:hypothetical protein
MLGLWKYFSHSLLFIYIFQASPINLKQDFEKWEIVNNKTSELIKLFD